MKWSLFTSLLMLSFGLLAQEKEYNRFFFDFGVGAAWQDNQIPRRNFGPGLSIGAGKWFLQNETNVVDFGLHLRYMTTHTYGLNRKPATEWNDAVSGRYDERVHYGDSAHPLMYDNHLTKLNDISLELMFSANRLRERSNVILYGFVGIGGSGYQTYINQLNADSLMYDYGSLAINEEGQVSKKDLKGLLDKSYESYAYGSLTAHTVFNVNAGIGLGYQISRGLSIGAEYKFTQTFSPYLDGIQYCSNSNGVLKESIDHHHYLSAFLRLRLGQRDKGGEEVESPPQAPVSSSVPKPGTKPATTVTNSGPTQNNSGETATVEKPSVVIITPNKNPYASANKGITVYAGVKGVIAKSDIKVKLNNLNVSNFSYNAVEKKVTIPVILNTGNNVVSVSVNNSKGNARAQTSISYNPPASPASTTSIKEAKEQSMSNGVSTNSGSTTTGSSSTSSTGSSSLGTNETAGQPASSSATNTTGLGSQSGSASSGKPPVVTYINPPSSPFNCSSLNYTVTATVSNVSLASQISVLVNGSALSSFSWNATTHTLSFPLSLDRVNATNVRVTGTNDYGNDIENVKLKYVGL